MRPFVIVCAVSLFSLSALAQRGGRAGAGPHASSGALHSGGSSGAGHSGAINRGGTGTRSGGWNQGGYRNGGYRGGYQGGHGYRRLGYGLSWYPYYGIGWGGYVLDPYYSGWSDYSGYNYAPPSYSSYDNGGYEQQPPVIVNQRMPYVDPAPPPEPPEPMVREFTPPAPSPPPNNADYGPVLYLFALKNNSILAAFTYWIEKGELHYVNLDHQMKAVPLNTIDRDLTDRLNRERNLTVRIPG